MGPEGAGVHPDLARASTLRASTYRDPAVYEAEKRRIFHDSWQAVGRAEQVARPGDYLAAEVAGEPIVVTRGKDGVLRALSNVCRHRGCLVVQGCGSAQSLQCPYHAWTYDLRGKLVGQPEFEGVEDWDRSKVALPELRAQVWGPYVFVHLGAGEPPLERVIGDIPAEIARFGVRFDGYRFLARREYLVQCNWKVYIDNYLEGYHIPTIHPALFRELDYKSYRVDTHEWYSFQHAPMRSVAGATALYYWVYPNFILNVYPANLSANLILPLGHDKTLAVFEWFVPAERWKDDPAYVDRLVAFSDQVQHEDTAICERVQKGLSSRSYDRGRFSPQRENGVHHFHRLWQDRMGSARKVLESHK